jgi:hypothetical protein
MLDGVPLYRFLQPVPASWATAAPDLARRAKNEASALEPDYIVTTAAANTGGTMVPSTTRASDDYTLLEVQDSLWRTYERVRKPNDTEEFCDPNQ